MPYALAEIAVTDKPFRVIKPSAIQSAQLLRLYTPILQRWRTSAATMMALYAMRDQEGVEAEDDNTAKEIAALLLLLRFREFFTTTETWHRSKWLANVKAATGVDATWMTLPPTVGPNRAARRAVASQTGGVVAAARNVPFTATQTETVTKAIQEAVASSLANARSLSEEARARIQNAVIGGMRSGATGETVARDINKGLGLSKKRAERIAENELDNAVKAMTRARMIEAGLNYGEWVHTRQQHPRIWHQARDGRILKLSDPLWSELYLPNCKCSMRPRLAGLV